MSYGFSNGVTVTEFEPVYYSIVIDMTNSAIYPSSTSTNIMASGGVEPRGLDYYSPNIPTNGNAIRRANGNARWDQVVAEMSQFANPLILNVITSASGATVTDGSTQTDTLSFTAKYENRGAITNTGFLGTVGSDGVTTITNDLASIKESIVRGITFNAASSSTTATTHSKTYRIYKTDTLTQYLSYLTVAQPSSAASIYPTVTVTTVTSVLVGS